MATGADLVRTKCTSIVAHGAGTRGQEIPFSPHTLESLCCPRGSYTTRSLYYWALPDAFQTLVSDTARFYKQFGTDTLYTFHYYLNMDRVSRRIRQRAKESNASEEREALRWMRARYSIPACIWMNVCGHVTVLGDVATTKEVMAGLKRCAEERAGIEHVLRFAEELAPQARKDRRRLRFAYIHDFVSQPYQIFCGPMP